MYGHKTGTDHALIVDAADAPLAIHIGEIMKKIIQLVSFLGLALIFGGVSANAQSVTKVDAKIPFDFVVGDRSLPAGDYVLRITDTSSGSQVLEIRDPNRQVLFTALMQENGDRAKHKAELVFDRTSGSATLAKIIMSDAGYNVAKAEPENRIASTGGQAGSVRN